MKRVLVTGARGFVGRHCLPLLAEAGFEVHGVASPGTAAASGQIAVQHRVDLLDAPSTTALLDEVRPTHVLHLAWFVKVDEHWTDPENLGWVGATLHLFRAAATRGMQRFVGTGTCAEYDPAVELCDETFSPLAPTSLYGICKLATEDCLRAAAPRLGVSQAWARLFLSYGPHDKAGRLVPLVIRSLLAGVPAACSAGTQVRDLLHVRDVASAIVALLDSDVQGPVNVASGNGIEVREVLRMIGDFLGCSELIRLGARPMRAGEPPRCVARTERLNSEVGWQPSVPLEAGLKETIEWLRRHPDA